MSQDLDVIPRKLLCQEISISKDTLMNWIANRGFPRPLSSSGREPIFSRSEVREWLHREEPEILKTPPTKNEVLRFQALFRGGKKAYGKSNIASETKSGKITPKYTSVKSPLTPTQYQAHLNSEFRLGVYVIDESDLCSFSVVDIDDYNVDHMGLTKKLKALQLPSCVCTSKSGGAHIYLFFENPENPAKVREVLGEVAKYVGYPKAEIFPKQNSISEGKVGSFINLPFVGGKSSATVCYTENGPLDFHGFLDYVESRLTTIEKIAAVVRSAAAEKSNPSSSSETREPSGRNDYLHSYACKLQRDGVSDDQILRLVNQKNYNATTDDHPNFVNGPLPDEEVRMLVSQALKHAKGQEAASNKTDVIDKFNSEYAHVMVGGKARIMHETVDPVTREPKLDFYQFPDFRSKYANSVVQVGKKLVCEADYWLRHPKRRSYGAIVFAPNMDLSKEVYNSYRGLSVEPKPGDCSLYFQHIRDIICSGDDDLFEYVKNWMANAIQNPAARPGVALALRGSMGVGKGAFVSHFLSLFGVHALQVSQTSHLVGHFNSHLQDKLLVFADEAFWAGDKKAEGALKALITEDTIAIERKGVDVERCQNYVRLIIASNNDWLIPAGTDERRFCVLDVSQARMQDTTYFKRLHEQMRSGGREALLFDLLNIDLEDIDLRKFPKTNALAEQKMETWPNFHKWLHHILQTGGIVIKRDAQGQPYNVIIWKDEVIPAEIHDNYKEMCRSMQWGRPIQLNEFGKKLKGLIPSVQKVRNGSEGRGSRYQLPSIEDARRHFLKNSKIPNYEWEDGPGQPSLHEA